MKDTFSQLSAASRGFDSQKVTNWAHSGSVVENSNHSQLNVVDAGPSACVSVHLTPMGTSLPVNPEGVIINNVIFDNLPRDPTHLFQQQSCAAATSLSMPVVISELNDTAFAPPTFDFAHVNPRTFVDNCVSNSVQAVPLHVLPSLQLITTVTTVTP